MLLRCGRRGEVLVGEAPKKLVLVFVIVVEHTRLRSRVSRRAFVQRMNAPVALRWVCVAVASQSSNEGKGICLTIPGRRLAPPAWGNSRSLTSGSVASDAIHPVPRSSGRRARGRSGGTRGGSSGSLLLRVGSGGASRRLEDARQMDVKVLDFDLAATLPEFADQDFGEAVCTVPTSRTSDSDAAGPAARSARLATTC
jgi:hypothetical protein